MGTVAWQWYLVKVKRRCVNANSPPLKCEIIGGKANLSKSDD